MATKRGYYKEELRRAVDNIEMSLTHLDRLVKAYGEAHPDISEMVKACGDALVMVAENLNKINESI